MIKQITLALVAATGITLAQTSVTTTTSNGTITEYAPGTTFTVRETSGPVSYSYGPNVTYTYRGQPLTTEQTRRIRVGAPVDVHYVTEGEKKIINKVEIDDDFELFDDED